MPNTYITTNRNGFSGNIRASSDGLVLSYVLRRTRQA